LQLDLPLREAREHFDSLYFNYQMEKEHGNISRIAEKAGIERTHLYRKLKQLGIKPLKKALGEHQ
jgi:DNA-binding NtrC family response regulator